MKSSRIGCPAPKGTWAATGLLCALLSGCGSGLHPVEGKVVWKDGTPAKELAGGQVVFDLPEKKLSARGVIREDGTFRLTSLNPDDGAPAGDYKVLILEHRKNANADGTQLAPPILDPRYADHKTSDLTATVSPGPNTVTLTVDRAPRP
jgi:hypothetical protein